MASLSELTALLNQAAAVLPKQGSIKDEERNAFFSAYENLRQQIETPIDAAVRVLFGVSLYISSLFIRH